MPDTAGLRRFTPATPGGRAVDVREARRIAVRSQLLDGSASSVLETVRHLGFLQLDPIATVAPAQHLVLWSRLGTYDVSELDRLCWEERVLFEWDAFLWPIEELPVVRGLMRRWTTSRHYASERWVREFIAENRPDLEGRVVMMTGDALGPEVIAHAREVSVVVKPLELRALRTALRHILGSDSQSKEKNSGRKVGADQKENA